MSTIAEIEAAIENLPAPQVDELARWLERLRLRRAAPPSAESWLQNARGAATAGMTTANVMARELVSNFLHTDNTRLAQMHRQNRDIRRGDAADS